MISIETAEDADLPVLVELESLLFAEDAGVHDQYADVTWPQREGADDFRRLLGDPNSTVIVARQDGSVVGLVVGYVAQSGPTRQTVTTGVLRGMYVRSNVRSQGVGERLTQSFLDWARTQGCAEARVDSYARNEPARRLYERSGFTPQSVSHILTL